jgi:hypothetical protein
LMRQLASTVEHVLAFVLLEHQFKNSKRDPKGSFLFCFEI